MNKTVSIKKTLARVLPFLLFLGLGATSVHAKTLLLDFGPTAVSGTDALLDPVHATGVLPSGRATWNTSITGDLTGGTLKWADNTTATGVLLQLGRGANPTINLNDDSYANNALGTTLNTGVYLNTSPMKDAIYSSSTAGTSWAVGARLQGMANGTYTIYVAGRNSNSGNACAMRVYATAAGSAGTYTYSSYPYADLANSSPAVTSSFVQGDNYVVLTNVVVTSANSYIYLAVEGRTNTEYRGFLNLIEVVQKETPTLTAPTAGAITYGQTLASSTLTGGAAANAAGDAVAGTFTFTTPSTAPGTGTASQNVTFTPTDTTNYFTATTTVSVTVNHQTPTLTAPTASAIAVGQTLASSVLTGGAATNAANNAAVAGSFAFTTPSTVPPLGTSSESVTFTPTDTANYNANTINVDVVARVLETPSISTLPTASAITYGQTLASSTLTGGGATNAAGDAVTGTFAFTTPSTAPSAGTASQSVTFTPSDTDTYTLATTTVDVTVNQASSSVGVVSSENPAGYKDSVTLTATVSSGAGTPTGAVQFKTNTVAFGSPVSLTAGVAALATTNLARGTIEITAEYGGDSNYFGSTNDLVGDQVVTNHPPVAVTDTYKSAINVPFNITIASLLTNDTDVDGDTVQFVDLATAIPGMTYDATSIYVPGTSINQSFTYRIQDGFGGTNTGTVQLIILHNLLLDFGPTAVAGTDALLDPAHATGAVSSDRANWNTSITSDITGGTLVYADGTAAGAAVQLQLGRGTNTSHSINLNDDTYVNNALGSTINGGVYINTSPMKDAIYGSATSGVGEAVGVRINGLPAGTYTLYVAGRNSNNNNACPMRFYAGVGASLGTHDYSSDSYVDVANSSPPTTSGFVQGENYGVLTVTTTSGSASLYISAQGTGTEVRGFMNLIEVVPGEAPRISTAPTASAITYGQTLADSSLTGGAATNAAGSTVPGVFTFTAPATAPKAGTASQNVTFTADDTTNYLPVTVSVSVLVNQASLTVTAAANTKTYDGNTTAAATPTITAGSIQAGDTANFTETYDTKDVGTGKTLTPAGSVNDGNGGANYNVTFTPAATGEIDQASLTVTAAANTKTYDGTTSATATPTITAGSIQSGDTEPAWTETYDTKNVGTGKTLTPAGVVSDGNGGANYNVTFTPVATGEIDQASLTVTAAANTKTYDGTTTATATPTVTAGSIQMGDTANFTENYGTRNVGTGKTLTPAGTVDDGNGGANYNVTLTPVTTGEIDQAGLTVTAAANSKTFDGTTSATATPTITAGSIQTGDTAPAWTETYDTRNVGTGKTLTPAGTVDDGNGGANYNVTLTPVTTGEINQAGLTVTAAANTKTYDGNTTATATPTITAGSIQTGDTAPAWTETYDTAAVGTGKTLTPAGTVLDGNGGANYNVTFTPVTTGVINSSVPCGGASSILGIVDNLDGTFTLTLQGTPNAEYYLVGSSDVTLGMNTWTPVLGSTNAAPDPSGQWSSIVSNAAPYFYRLMATDPCGP